MNDEDYAAWRDEQLVQLRAQHHKTADGHLIELGQWYWNNDLQPVKITEVARSFNSYQDRWTQVWHATVDENGRRSAYDSLVERPDIGRLTKYWDGRSASPGKYPTVVSWLDRNWETVVSEANRRGLAAEEFVVHMLDDVLDVYGEEKDSEIAEDESIRREVASDGMAG